MMTRMITGLFVLAVVIGLIGFAVLAVWDVPVTTTTVEKNLDVNALQATSRP